MLVDGVEPAALGGLHTSRRVVADVVGGGELVVVAELVEVDVPESDPVREVGVGGRDDALRVGRDALRRVPDPGEGLLRAVRLEP
ncbi:hypothetical protein [Streptomyces sp. NBC_01092]|uniref:hypothetical protein n=1 Tax=Streptomyces sp. NBC_01092 TaxID=2903748 RepID=UPI00386596FE|nr:hypothetical protein OG254_01990 [Streptomyces sp. NBC_01092]